MCYYFEKNAQLNQFSGALTAFFKIKKEWKKSVYEI